MRVCLVRAATLSLASMGILKHGSVSVALQAMTSVPWTSSHMALGRTHHRCSAGMANICVPLMHHPKHQLRRNAGFLKLGGRPINLPQSQSVGEMRGWREEERGYKNGGGKRKKGCRWRNMKHIVWTWAHRRITRSRFIIGAVYVNS